MAGTVWQSGGCRSWYIDAHRPQLGALAGLHLGVLAAHPPLRPGGLRLRRRLVGTRRADASSLFVTGAARGIGAHTARHAAARGARVALVGLEPDRLAALAAELGDAARWFAADVTDQAALDAAAAGTLEAYGGIDAVVANAGIANRGTVAVGDREAAGPHGRGRPDRRHPHGRRRRSTR